MLRALAHFVHYLFYGGAAGIVFIVQGEHFTEILCTYMRVFAAGTGAGFVHAAKFIGLQEGAGHGFEYDIAVFVAFAVTVEYFRCFQRKVFCQRVNVVLCESGA